MFNLVKHSTYKGVDIFRNGYGEYEYTLPSGTGYVSPTLARVKDIITNTRKA